MCMLPLAGQPATEEDMLGVMRAVVDKYHGDMTEGTLFALAGYSQAAYSQGHDFVGGIYFCNPPSPPPPLPYPFFAHSLCRLFSCFL